MHLYWVRKYAKHLESVVNKVVAHINSVNKKRVINIKIQHEDGVDILNRIKAIYGNCIGRSFKKKMIILFFTIRMFSLFSPSFLLNAGAI